VAVVRRHEVVVVVLRREGSVVREAGAGWCVVDVQPNDAAAAMATVVRVCREGVHVLVILELVGAVAVVVDAAAPVVVVATAQEVLQLGAFGFRMMPPICEKVQANRNWISLVSKHKSNAL
jgi:hypothetical protein